MLKLPFDIKKISRRRFLELLVSLSCFLPANALTALPLDKTLRKFSQQTLKAYLDTLLPEDLTPSATQLEVDEALLAEAHKNQVLERLLAFGCEWLDKQARELGAESFAVLNETSREKVVASAEKAPKNSLPLFFFNYTRRKSFKYFYANPASWQGIGYTGPPQPIGYPDHFLPPKAQDKWPNPR